MADEDKEKAEKVAAAKKRVSNPPGTSRAHGTGTTSSTHELILPTPIFHDRAKSVRTSGLKSLL
jgi:hypothetical protein